ncbi:MAG: DUF433 domain-containing protein [Acetobacterales bacterium]
MSADHTRDLSPNEVAVLSDVSARMVRKAVEEAVLSVGEAELPGLNRVFRRALDPVAVEYMTVMTVMGEIGWSVPKAGKMRIVEWLSHADPENAPWGHVVIHGPLTLDVSVIAPRIAEARKRTAEYRRARAHWIVSDPDIMGGTPTIRGTRMTVYSVLGRLDAGETLQFVAEENPDIPLAALGAAAVFARANPLRGRPSGRPWAHAA